MHKFDIIMLPDIGGMSKTCSISHIQYAKGFYVVFAWNKLETGRMESIIVVLDHVRRVGGTYALLLANPCLRSAQKKLI